MNIVEIITIGREILDGRVVDTNSVKIAEALRPLGLVPRFGQRVDDDIDRIIGAFSIASNRSQVVLVTGGLGPTSDDLTAQAFAKFQGEPLVLNEQALEQITRYFKRAGREPADILGVQKKQAFLPHSCFILENKQGTAPGFGLERQGTSWFFMPGVPHEMLRMLSDQVIALLPKTETRSCTWATQFVSEGELQERLTPLEKRLPAGFEVTYRTRFPENHIGLYATGAADAEFKKLCDEITQLLGNDVFTFAKGADVLKTLEEVVVTRLCGSGHFLATVESCTGGLIANRITDVAGASKVYWGSQVVYDNAAKEVLGVPRGTLVQHGAVSTETARLLAEAGLAKMTERPGITVSGKAICIATTGIAGPAGGTEKKPVGLCYLALAREGQPTLVEEIRGRPVWSRDYQKTFFAQKALELVRRHLPGI